MGAIANSTHTLTAAVADDATFTTAYPAGQTQATLDGTTGGKLVIDQQTWVQGADPGVLFTFGASTITVTNKTGAAFPISSDVIMSFGQVDINGSYNLTYPKQIQDQVADLETRVVDLETP